MIRWIAGQFLSEGTPVSCTPLGAGRVNETFLLRWKNRDTEQYVLQKLSKSAFPDPDTHMRNLRCITDHLTKNNAPMGFPVSLPARDGRYFVCDAQGFAWRMHPYLEGDAFEHCPDSPAAFETGRAFGLFLHSLADFDVTKLTALRPDFHNTRAHLARLTKHAEAGIYPKTSEISALLHEINAMKSEACVICDALADGTLPLRAVHGDTKISNVLFDSKTHKSVAVIDLDTVMAGSPLYDFGDAVRSIGFVRQGGRMVFDPVRYDAFCQGWLPASEHFLSKREREWLRLSVFTVTLELAARYLDDWLTDGDYFRRPQAEKLARAKELLACCHACGFSE